MCSFFLPDSICHIYLLSSATLLSPEIARTTMPLMCLSAPTQCIWRLKLDNYNSSENTVSGGIVKFSMEQVDTTDFLFSTNPLGMIHDRKPVKVVLGL